LPKSLKKTGFYRFAAAFRT